MESIFYSNFGKNMRRVFKEKQLSQAAVAQRMGTSVMQVSRWVCGRSTPSVKTFCRLCEILEVSPGDFYVTPGGETPNQRELFPEQKLNEDAKLMREYMEFKKFQRLSSQYLKAS